MRVPVMLVAAGVALSGCTQGTSTEVSVAVSSPQSTTVRLTTSTLRPTRLPEPRWIEVSGDRFTDTRTGEAFTPIGVNLLLKTGGGGGDKMFLRYDPEWVEDQLSAIVDLEFNTVRFFLDMCMACTASSAGIDETYLDNLADLLTRTEAHGLVVLPTSNDVPDPGFSERLPCCDLFGGYRNSLYLSAEGHQIAIEYWSELIRGIQARGAPTHHVLGWELANEQFVLRSVPPINLTEGTVTTADGETYDLASDAEVEQMVVNNARTYVAAVGNDIRALDEGALITMGFFSAEDPEAGRTGLDDRWVIPRQMMAESSLDFIDLHGYGGLGGTWRSIGASYGLDGSSLGYPLILGEFGAFESAYPDRDEAAAAVARWQADSCRYGLGGWLVWFWGADKDDEVVTADSDGARVARAISPLVRPDPCDAGPYESDNLALGRPASASAAEPGYPPFNVTDGSDATWWSAESEPPEWVEIDLESAQRVGRVEILIGHVSPPGPQAHRVYVRGEGEPAPGTSVGTVTAADAKQGDWLSLDFGPIEGVRHLRVETLSADGWVILHEVRVLAD